MLPRILLCRAGALALVLGLMPSVASAQQLDNPRCPFLFNQYEVATRVFGENSYRRDQMLPSGVMNAARSLRMGNCLTFTDAMTGMDKVSGRAGGPAGSGAPIAPVYLHAGIVTSMADDAKAREFFEAHGFQARSVGAVLLGRRIYVGPINTTGGFEEARNLALAAGFAYPYAAQF